MPSEDPLMSSTRDLVGAVLDRQRESHERVGEAASDVQIARLRASMGEVLGAHLPSAYADMLQIVNGLSYNGLLLYSSRSIPTSPAEPWTVPGVVEANEGWRDAEEMVDRVVFGESNGALLVFNQKADVYEVADGISLYAFSQSSSLDDLLSALLVEALEQ